MKREKHKRRRISRGEKCTRRWLSPYQIKRMVDGILRRAAEMRKGAPR